MFIANASTGCFNLQTFIQSTFLLFIVTTCEMIIPKKEEGGYLCFFFMATATKVTTIKVAVAMYIVAIRAGLIAVAALFSGCCDGDVSVVESSVGRVPLKPRGIQLRISPVPAQRPTRMA